MAAIKMEGTQNNSSYHIHRAERNKCKLARLRSSRPGLLCTVAIKTLTKRTWRGKRLFLERKTFIRLEGSSPCSGGAKTGARGRSHARMLLTSLLPLACSVSFFKVDSTNDLLGSEGLEQPPSLALPHTTHTTCSVSSGRFSYTAAAVLHGHPQPWCLQHSGVSTAAEADPFPVDFPGFLRTWPLPWYVKLPLFSVTPSTLGFLLQLRLSPHWWFLLASLHGGSNSAM